MNNNEFMAKVTEMVMQDPSMRESLKKLYDELAQIEPSTEQKPDMTGMMHIRRPICFLLELQAVWEPENQRY